MARTVYLHVGTMKSATTYLQGLFDLNAERLSAAGVLWPGADAVFLGVAEFRGTEDVDRPGRQGAWRRLIERVQAYSGNVLISNELLAPLPRQKVKVLLDALRPARIEVLVTARNLARGIPSHWQTTLTNGSATPWSEFAATVCRDTAPSDSSQSRRLWGWFWRRHDLAEIARRWSAEEAVSHLTLVTVPPSNVDPLLAGRRFATSIGVVASSWAQPAFGNSSVGAHSAELLRRINATAGERDRNYYRWGIKGTLAMLLAERTISEPRFGLTDAQSEWVSRRADRMIQDLQRSAVQVVGDIDDLRAPTVADSGSASVDPASVRDSDVLAAALDGLVGMAAFTADLSKDRDARLRNGD